jgi:GH25 family lysozyme M1 (1,4-beta-N-acetylmuramidase)
MCKVTEGLTIADPAFASNWNALWELNRMMPRFGYHFFHASDDPVQQAERFVANREAAWLAARRQPCHGPGGHQLRRVE